MRPKLIIGSFLITLFSCLQLNAQEFLSLEEIEKLRVYDNLRTALRNPDKVQVLKLRKRRYSKVPDEIYKFLNLVSLDLGENNISEVPRRLFYLPKIQVLKFDGCAFEHTCRS